MRPITWVDRTRKKPRPRRAIAPLEPRFLERARAHQGALSQEDRAMLKGVMETLAFVTAELEAKQTSINRLRRFLFGATTEKTRTFVAPGARPPSRGPQMHPAARRRLVNGHAAHAGDTRADRATMAHPALHRGDGCPGCTRARCIRWRSRRCWCGSRGWRPLGATVYECDRCAATCAARCSPRRRPRASASEKYDETAARMIGLLKYGSGLPFNRLESLQRAWAFRCRPRRSGRSCATPRRSSCPPSTS